MIAKYEQEIQKIIQDYENEEIDNKILVATTSFDAILSYNEIIYYNGKTRSLVIKSKTESEFIMSLLKLFNLKLINF